MAKCRMCGKRIAWLRDVCPECEAIRLSRMMGGGSGQPVSGSSQTVVRTSSSTTINIVINGKPVHFATEGEVTPEMLERLSADVGVPRKELGELLTEALRKAGESVSSYVSDRTATPGSVSHDLSTGLAAHGPLHKVKCPRCERTVPDRNGWCMYCGAELAAREATPTRPSEEPVNDVDGKFLGQDVRPSAANNEKEQEKEQEGVRETYKDRLSDL